MRQLSPSGHFHRDVKPCDARMILLDFQKVIDGRDMTPDAFIAKHRAELESILRDKADL